MINQAKLEEIAKLSKASRYSTSQPVVPMLNVTPEQVALNSYLSALSIEERRDVAAIAWMGRGDFANFSDAIEHSRRMDEGLTTYLSEKPLHEYIPAGITTIANEPFRIEPHQHEFEDEG